MTVEAIRIRPFARSDYAALLSWFPDEPSLVQWGGPEVTFPLDEVQLDPMNAEALSVPPSRALWTGMYQQSVAGHAQIALDWRHGIGRLGRVSISPEYRGRGLAAPFLAKVIDALFEDTSFERLELNVYTFNEAAIRTYLRLGFKQEGVRRSSVRAGGERWDTAMFGLLRTERDIAP